MRGHAHTAEGREVIGIEFDQGRCEGEATAFHRQDPASHRVGRIRRSLLPRRIGAISAAGERIRNTALGSIDGLKHLRDLNPAQRSAVEYGIGGNAKPPPALLIAAGAGTGKTKTLAHRVAHLILNGTDPQRLLLLTFTRRAALEMTRRAQQILAEARGGAAHRTTPPTGVLPWSGAP